MTDAKSEQTRAGRLTAFVVSMALLIAWAIDLLYVSDYGGDWPVAVRLVYGAVSSFFVMRAGRFVGAMVDAWVLTGREIKEIKARRAAARTSA
jgi:hypothetical protein